MQNIVLSCLVFLLFLVALPTNPPAMFTDPDTAWHLATGDLIRELGHLPEHDTWSFASGNQRWLNASWGWDVIASWLHLHFGWHGVIIFNSACIAATLALIFAACFARTGHGIASFVTVLFIVVTMLNFSIRPHQLSISMAAAFTLVLAQTERKAIGLRWLALLPPLMLIWANCHGAFIVGLFLIGLYGLAALVQKDRAMVKALFISGALAALACLFTPSGWQMAETVMRSTGSVTKPMLSEWAPLDFGFGMSFVILYLLLFLVAAIRGLPSLRGERWSAYAFAIMGVTCARNIMFFAIASAPLVATQLRDYMQRGRKEQPVLHPLVAALCERGNRFAHSAVGALGMLALCLAATGALLTPAASAYYQTAGLAPFKDLSQEIAFIEEHYPQTHFLNHYNLGGLLVYYTRGHVKVFADGRTEAAYPAQTLSDYMAFQSAIPGWEKALDRYRIGGLIVPLADDKMMDRFNERKGWKLAFSGRTAAVFIRQGQE